MHKLKTDNITTTKTKQMHVHFLWNILHTRINGACVLRAMLSKPFRNCCLSAYHGLNNCEICGWNLNTKWYYLIYGGGLVPCWCWSYVFVLKLDTFTEKTNKTFQSVSSQLKLIEAEWRRYASVNLSSLVQIMACRLVGAKPLSEPMLEYY